MITLNRIVAVAMVHGAQDALRQLDAASSDDALAAHHRVDAVRAHLLDMVGDRETARHAYLQAAECTLSVPEQRYLKSRAQALGTPSRHDPETPSDAYSDASRDECRDPRGGLD